MPIDTEHLKQVLLAKREDLREEIARYEENARDSGNTDVGDPIDDVVTSEAKSLALGGTDIAARTLEQVEAALQRIDDGEYGICVDDGEPIEVKRLEAVPWTPYCLKDQEKHDKEGAEPSVFETAG